MIQCITPCENCIHKYVCMNEGNAENAAIKLKNTIYGKGINNDYSWDEIMKTRHVDVSFSCKHFKEAGNVNFNTK